MIGSGSRTTWAVALCVALAMLAACGSRQSYDKLLTAQAGKPAANASVGTPGSNVSSDAGSGSGLGTSSGAGGDATTTTLAAALGGSGGSTGGSTASGVAAAPGATGPAAVTCTGKEAPIVLGSVGTQSGLIGSIVGTSIPAVQAWVKSVNATGGLSCHQVRYLVADDGGDPAKNQALVSQMVEQQGVIAFLQMNAVLSGEGTAGYLAQKGIPVIGSEGGSNWFYEHPSYFPATSSGAPTVESTFAAASVVGKQQGKTVFGTLSCIEAAICSSVPGVADGFATKYGVKVVYKGQASLVQPDFTSTCQGAKSAGVQVLVVYMDGNSIQRLGRSCSSVGFHPIIVANGLGVVQQLTADPNLDGVYGAVVTIPWTETGNSEVALARKAVSQYAPGYALGPNLMQGWAAARLFQLATSHLTTFTSASILDAMAKVAPTDLSGITNTVHFGPGRDATKDYCVWLVQIHNHQFTSPSAAPTKCGVS